MTYILCLLGLHHWVPTSVPHTYLCSRCYALTGGHP